MGVVVGVGMGEFVVVAIERMHSDSWLLSHTNLRGAKMSLQSNSYILRNGGSDSGGAESGSPTKVRLEVQQ